MAGEKTVAIGKPQSFLSSSRNWLLLVLAVVAYWFALDKTQISLHELLNPGSNFGSVIRDFVTPDLSAASLQTTFDKMLETIFLALMATTAGTLLAIPASFLAARNLVGRSRLGLPIYYATRTVFNFLRAIDPFILTVLFALWVSIGPFSGVLALVIVTTASLGKMFSEAIESIDTGPMEAITATGANRLQSIVFAVIPQIVPPFTSFTIYHWDINIRISTIIGFAGGGGIGYYLQSQVNLLQYHRASTAVYAIVLVVAAMDFASAKIRERMV